VDSLITLAAVLLWGGNAVVTKASADVIGPAEIAFYRWLIAALVLAPPATRSILRNLGELRRSLGRLVLLGVLGCGLFPYLMYLAARDTSAINLGIIQALMPLLAIALSHAIVGAPTSRGVWLGAAFSLLGVAIVVSHGRLDLLLSLQVNRGDLIMLAATACFALYSVLLKHWRTALPLTASLFVQAAAAAVILLPAILLEDRGGLSADNLGLVLYAGALASIAAPLLWMHGVARIGPARAAVFFNLLPVVTAALAVALLDEALTVPLVIGGAMAIGGVALAERRGRRVS
jgi:drug/metabolite transporter (DMT)-like permease